RGGAGDRVATEGRGMAPTGPIHHRGSCDDGAQGEPDGDPLGQAEDVAGDSPMLGREHLPGPPDPALDLVKDEQDAMLIAELAESRQEVEGRDDITSLALDRLDEDGGQLLRRADGPQQGADALEIAV